MRHLVGKKVHRCNEGSAWSVPRDGVGGWRARSSVGQGVTGVKQEGENGTIQQVEEFWASDTSGDCCQIPQRELQCSVSLTKPAGGNINGRRDYVSLVSLQRCGLGMTIPHSPHRTMPASCSVTETESEIRRPCVQRQGGLFGRDFRARFDPSSFMVHLRDRTVADLR
jgi:hypothetical protein